MSHFNNPRYCQARPPLSGRGKPASFPSMQDVIGVQSLPPISMPIMLPSTYRYVDRVAVCIVWMRFAKERFALLISARFQGLRADGTMPVSLSYTVCK